MELMNYDNKTPTAFGTYLGRPEPKKFLVVEDDLEARPIWDRIIKAVDPRAIIRWATTEEGAEELIVERQKLGDRFDYVIADIFLAGPKTGIDLWKRFGGGTMPFLFTSSVSRSQFIQMIGDRLTVYPMLVRKPFSIDDCVDSLLELLRERRLPTSGLM